MWPWRTWFSGDYLVDCWIWWFPKSLPTLMTPWFGWWAHRPSLVKTSWRDLSLQHSSPKAEGFSPLRESQPEQDSVWGEQILPSPAQGSPLCVCVCDQPVFRAVKAWLKILWLIPEGKAHIPERGTVQCVCWKLFWANPGAAGAWSWYWMLAEKHRTLLGCSAKTGMRGWVRSESPRGV